MKIDNDGDGIEEADVRAIGGEHGFACGLISGRQYHRMRSRMAGSRYFPTGFETLDRRNPISPASCARESGASLRILLQHTNVRRSLRDPGLHLLHTKPSVRGSQILAYRPGILGRRFAYDQFRMECNHLRWRRRYATHLL